jgi:hypothetical protein
VFANGLRAELRALFRHLGEVQSDNHGRHTNLAADGVDGVVVRTNREGDPFVPGNRTDVFFRLNFEGGGDVGGHHAKGLLWRAHVDGLPVSVEDQDDGLIQYVQHKIVKTLKR